MDFKDDPSSSLSWGHRLYQHKHDEEEEATQKITVASKGHILNSDDSIQQSEEKHEYRAHQSHSKLGLTTRSQQHSDNIVHYRGHDYSSRGSLFHQEGEKTTIRLPLQLKSSKTKQPNEYVDENGSKLRWGLVRCGNVGPGCSQSYFMDDEGEKLNDQSTQEKTGGKRLKIPRHVDILFGKLQSDHKNGLKRFFMRASGEKKDHRARRKSKVINRMGIKKMIENSGFASSDAFYQLQELRAISGDIESMRKHHTPYPLEMLDEMLCHIRALWNVSREAALKALRNGVKHTETEKVKSLLEEYVSKTEGQVFRLRKFQFSHCHWVALTHEYYTDDFHTMNTSDYKLASAILSCLESHEEVFGNVFHSNSVLKEHFILFIE